MSDKVTSAAMEIHADHAHSHVVAMAARPETAAATAAGKLPAWAVPLITILVPIAKAALLAAPIPAAAKLAASYGLDVLLAMATGAAVPTPPSALTAA